MKSVLVTSLALSLSGALPVVAGDGIKVMTQNQSLGADFASLLAPPGGDFNAELVRILQQIAATDFPARAQRQAKEIARRMPHLVGLQEVWALSCIDQNPSDEQGCEDPAIPTLSSIIWTKHSTRSQLGGPITTTSQLSRIWI